MSTSFAKTRGQKKGFIHHTIRFSASTVISRLLGLIREQVFSHFFGATAAVDSFNAAFRIPNLLRDFFAEGALSVAYVPVFAEKMKSEGVQKAFLLTSSVLSILLVILGAVSILGIIASPWLVAFIAPGFSRLPGQLELTTLMTRIMFPFLIFVAMAAAVMGTLNCFGRFGLPALAPAAFNFASIVAGLFFRQFFDPPILVMAWGATIGGVMQLAVQLPQLYRLGFRFRLRLDFADEAVRKIIRLMGPAALGVAAAQVNIIVGTMLASLLPEGSIAYLNYAFRLMHFPLGVFGVAVATVSLPELSAMAASEQPADVFSRHLRACRAQLLLLIPSAMLLIVTARPLCALIYQHGKFGWNDSINAGFALQAYAGGLVFFGLVRLVAQVFYAYKDTATPVKISMLTVVVNIALSLLLMRPLGFVGLALAPALSAAFNLNLLAYTLRRRLRSPSSAWQPSYRPLMGYAFCVLMASIVGAAACLAILVLWGGYDHYWGVFSTGAHLAVALMVGIVVYSGLAYVLKVLRREQVSG